MGWKCQDVILSFRTSTILKNKDKILTWVDKLDFLLCYFFTQKYLAEYVPYMIMGIGLSFISLPKWWILRFRPCGKMSLLEFSQRNRIWSRRCENKGWFCLGSAKNYRSDPILTNMTVSDYDEESLHFVCNIYEMDDVRMQKKSLGMARHASYEDIRPQSEVSRMPPST